MEEELLEWIRNYLKQYGEMPENQKIKTQAKILSKKDDFKASKGWCDKFLKRNSKALEKFKM